MRLLVVLLVISSSIVNPQTPTSIASISAKSNSSVILPSEPPRVTYTRDNNSSSFTEANNLGIELPPTEFQRNMNRKRIIVSFRHVPGIAEHTMLLKSFSKVAVKELEFSSSLHLKIISCQTVKKCGVLSRDLLKLPSVQAVSFDREYRLSVTPNDLSYESTWGMKDINAPAAWDITTGERSVIVGVVDTGVDLNHPDLVENLWINSKEIPNNNRDDDNNGYVDDIHGWDFVSNDNVPNDDVIPGVWGGGHGTHVAGTIAARGNNEIGVAGVSWQSQLMALRVCNEYGGCWMGAVIEALNYAYRNGAQVANVSLGGDYSADPVEKSALEAVGKRQTGLRKGVVIIAAAGNSGKSNEQSPFHPASYRISNLVSVAATAPDRELASFSNYSVTNVDIAAPGFNIFSTLPEGAFGQSGGYGWLSGTSMASPHVAGVAALMHSQGKNWTASEIRELLLQSVNINPSLSEKVFSGGVVDAFQALSHSQVPSKQLAIRMLGTGFGKVIINNEHICDDAVCRVAISEVSSLLAEPSENSNFESWMGGCQTGRKTCEQILSSLNTVVDAIFNQPPGYDVVETKIAAANSVLTYTDNTARYSGNFTNTQLSADGNVRAKAVFRWPDQNWCEWMTSDTGGIVIEEKSPTGWTQKARFTAPTLDASRNAGRFTNCNGFGQFMQMSDDGNTLAVYLGTHFSLSFAKPSEDYILCGFVIYRKDSQGRWNESKIIKPQDKYFCLDIIQRDEQSITLSEASAKILLSADGDTLLYGEGAGTKFLSYDISNLDRITTKEILVPLNCKAWSHPFHDLFNPAINGDGSAFVTNVYDCENNATAMIMKRVGDSYQAFFPETPPNVQFIKSAISEDGKNVALSYTANAYSNSFSSVVMYNQEGDSYTKGIDLKDFVDVYGLTACHKFTDSNTQLICDSRYARVGRNDRHGSVIIYSAINNDWAAGVTQEDLWVTNQYQYFNLYRPLFASASDNGEFIETSIHGFAVEPRNAKVIGTRFDLRRSPQVRGQAEISGTFVVGSSIALDKYELLAVDYSKIEFSWYRCVAEVPEVVTQLPSTCSLIEGASTSAYTLQDLDFNKFILGRITASNDYGTLRHFSKPSISRVVETLPLLVIPPRISGNLTVGQTLTAEPGTWQSVTAPTFQYRWFQCSSSLVESCQVIQDASSQSYVVKETDLNTYLKVEITSRNTAGAMSASTAPVGQISGYVVSSVSLSIQSSKKRLIASVLNINLGIPTPTSQYQWFRCKQPVNSQVTSLPTSCRAIKSATTSSYKPIKVDKGKHMVFGFTYSNDYGRVGVFSKSKRIPQKK